MNRNMFVFSCLFCIFFSLSSCFKNNNSQQVKPQQLLVVITDANGKVATSEIIDGDINNRRVIEQFAKNLAKNPGYSYAGGSWNESGQFLGVVNTPAGKMFVAIRSADEQPNQTMETTPTETVQAEPEPPASSGPFELWNGFTTDMSEEQVIEKARQSLQVTQTPVETAKNHWGADFGELQTLPGIGPIQFTKGSSTDRILNNRSFIIGPDNTTEWLSFIDTRKVRKLGYESVIVASPMPSYLQDKKGTGDLFDNIFFYFYQDELFAVIIYWARNIETEKLIAERYGESTAIMNDYGKYSQTWVVWKLNDRLIYSYTRRGTQQKTTCYITRYYVERAIENFERREATRKAEEEEKRKASIEGAVF